MEKAFTRVVTLPFESKAYEEDGEMFVEGIITTQDIDRTGEVMDMKGLKNWAAYKKNPIAFWWHQEPIGHAVELERRDDNIYVKDQLAPTKLVLETVWPLLKNKSIRTMSIGFSPVGEPATEEIDGIRHWTSWELLEHSLVPVPANPKTSARIAKALGLEMDAPPLSTRAVVPYQNLPALEDTDHPWDAGAARKRIAAWASSDGSGDKDKIDWGKYKQAFFWYDAANAENVTSYKLPYADIVEGGLKAIFRGVVAVVAVLKGGRGGADIPQADQDAIWGQCAKYYKKWDKEMPEKGLDGELIWKADETEFITRQQEAEMCRGRIERIGGGIQGVSDIAAHWQRAGAGFIEVMGEEYLEKLSGARKSLDAILRAEEPGNEPGQGKSAIEANVEAVLGEIFPLAEKERLYEVCMARLGVED